jgi:hypothetical protein
MEDFLISIAIIGCVVAAVAIVWDIIDINRTKY